MARDTDLCGRSKQLARLPWITIPLAQMDAICPKPFGQVHAIIDDKRYIAVGADTLQRRSEEHTSELQSLMRISYAVFCLKKKKKKKHKEITHRQKFIRQNLYIDTKNKTITAPRCRSVQKKRK